MPKIHILRAGEFRDCKGRTVDLSDQDMREIAAGYERNSAPLIVGHSPKTDEPAHGWAASLSANSRGLFADVPRLTKEMRSWIKEKRYRRVSSRLVRKAGKWTLDHIGMLGARTPSVSGLDPVELAGELDPEDVVVSEIDLADMNETDDATTLVRQVLDLFRKETNDGSAQPGDGGNLTKPEGAGGSQRTDLAADLAAEREKRQKLEGQVSRLLAQQKLTAAGGAVKAAADAGRLLPRDEEPMTAVLAALADVTVDGEPMTVELAAAGSDDEPRELSLADYVQDFLGRLPEQVPQGEIARGTDDPPGKVESVELAAGREVAVDGKRMALHRRAVELQRANEGMTYIEAVKQAGEEV